MGDRKIGVVRLVVVNLSLTEEQKQRALEMALNDKKVKELIDGKNYNESRTVGDI